MTASQQASPDNNIGLDVIGRGKILEETLKAVSSHPTSGSFDPKSWKKALQKDDLDESSKRLLVTGQWIGRRLSALRGAFPKLFDGFDPEDAIECAVGYANATYLNNHVKFSRAKRDEGRKAKVGTTLLGHTVIKNNGTGQVISEDHLVTTIVDSLSHALYYALNANSSSARTSKQSEEAAKAFRFSNIEFVYRATWLQSIWEGYFIEAVDADVFLRPCTNQYGEWWPVWDVRRQNLIAEQLTLMSNRVFGPLQEEKVPEEMHKLVPRKRVTKANWRDGNWHFRSARVRRSDQDYRAVVAAAIGIRESSLWPYTSEVVPQYREVGLTLGDVLTGWHVLETCAVAMAGSISKKNSSQIADIREFSLRLSKDTVVGLVQDCAGFDHEKAKAFIDFLSVDLTDTNHLFNKGVWSNPLVPGAEAGLVRIVLPVLTIGNIVRSFENWIEQCNFSRAGELKGAYFEGEVVDHLKATASSSELPVKVEVFGPNIDFMGEEIDALLVVGKTVMVLECKNFLTPGDSLERHNVLKRIIKGASQAQRKADVVGSKLGQLSDHLGKVIDQSYTIRPVVVVASPYGVGLNIGIVPVVDLDYLIILSGSMSMTSAMIQNGQDQIQEVTHLYQPFGFSQERLHSLIQIPFVQRKYFEALKWTYQPFPTGNKRIRFMLPFPLVTADSDIAKAKEMVAQMRR